jgi:N6-L-threonylcarbamoyladenine synthase
MPTILALETSCDETAVAITRGHAVLASEISSQIPLHQPYGGVVPELASRNHLPQIRPLIEAALRRAGVRLTEIDAFAATAGPGLASSLLIGNTVAKGLALAHHKPFLAINHLEGHLLSPFVGAPGGVVPCVALIVSGGHTLLLHCRSAGHYQRLGNTKDDAAGEAFDKTAKMLGLPYPGGPAIDRLARTGNPDAFDLPRGMLHSGNLDFSFSGLKTAVLYTLEKQASPLAGPALADMCASIQAAIIDVLVAKTLAAARLTGASVVAVSGGVSMNSGLRARLAAATTEAGLDLRLAAPTLTTDNAAMIGFVAGLRLAAGQTSSLTDDVDPNLPLETTPAP